MLWLKLGGGVLAILVGVTWIAQGLNVLGGSSMSGHPAYSVLGLLVACLGGWMIGSALRARGRLGAL